MDMVSSYWTISHSSPMRLSAPCRGTRRTSREQQGTATYYPTCRHLRPFPRTVRVVVPGFARHITQLGNIRQDIFFTDDDRRFHLRTLGEQPRLHGVDIMVCCLRINHAHLAILPRDAAGLEVAVGCTHWRCAKAINRPHEPSDHAWQGGLLPCPLDDEHALAGVRFVVSVRESTFRQTLRGSAPRHRGGTSDSPLKPR